MRMIRNSQSIVFVIFTLQERRYRVKNTILIELNYVKTQRAMGNPFS